MNTEYNPQDAWKQFSAGWRKWDEIMMNFTRPISNEMIRMLQIRGYENVLDVATGTGEPALTIASRLKNGKVTATDLSEEMLQTTLQNAEKRKIKNVETKVCDASSLPFPDHAFDVVICRLAMMLFPQPEVALKEMLRVLKPGGKIVAAVWNVPEKNFWVTAMMSTIREHMKLPLPSPDAPGIFRGAREGLIKNLFQQAGLKNVIQKEINGKLECNSPEEYWELMSEAGAAIAAALSKADESMKQQIKDEVIHKINEKYPNGHIAIDSSALVIHGEK